MYIYKFTHKETGRCYIGQTIQDPNRRSKGGTKKESFSKGKKGWKMIDGKQIWFYKEAVV